MAGFELYVFFLCLIVFLSLTALFTFMICYIGKQSAALIVNGLEDDKIKERLTKKLNRKATKTGKFFEKAEQIFSIVLCVVLCVLFVSTIVSSVRGDNKVKSLPAIKVIASTSMSEKYENNTYLFQNDLNDQLQMFDVVLLHELPPEEELELYNIVVYEHISGALLIHRIIGIEEPNAEHPDEYHFLLQGDAVHYPDSFPVRYSQMKSIYRGERVSGIGSFVYFVQSPAGVICLILLAISLLMMPIANNYLLKKEYARVLLMVENNELDSAALALYQKGKKKKAAEDATENGGADE